MSWESATCVLYAPNPTPEQIDSLSRFVTEHADELRKCYDPKYLEQRPVISKFVSRLFVLLEREETPETAVEKRMAKAVEEIADLLTREEFFKGVFHHALKDGDVSLLELVYSSLFTEIVFNSNLTSLWFQERLEIEKSGKRFTAVARALNILISVQFLDIRQDWTAVKPPSDLLISIQKQISASKESVLKLVWNLALYFMAQQHYGTDRDDDGIDIEPLMQELQVNAGVHWSQALKDQLQVSLMGLDSLLASLEIVRKEHTLQFVSSQLLAQTVADVVSCLFTVSKPTESLCAALATAVEPFPGLQQVPWIPEKQLALIKAKCPSSLGSLVPAAQVLDLASRVDYLREMRTYVCAVDASYLDIDGNSQDGPELGSDVRTTKILSVLPPRVTDHQGKLELAPNTRGTLLAYDGTDCLVMWYFTYNGWSLLGRILENADLIEENNWKPMTVELLKLVSITVDISVLTAMSAGLARGDIVDLIASRLQSWVHAEVYDHCVLAFDFLSQFALIDPPRIWALLNSIVWSTGEPVLEGVSRLLAAVWPTFDRSLSLHCAVMNKMLKLFGSQYLFANNITALEVFRLCLPRSAELRDDILNPSPLHEASVTPLLSSLHKPEVLNFCKFCIETRKLCHVEKKFTKEDGPQELKSLQKRHHQNQELQLFQSQQLQSQQPQQAQQQQRPQQAQQPQLSHGSHDEEDQSFLEKQLFVKSGEIASLFLSGDRILKQAIVELWTAMVDNPSAPPLLAFLDQGQAQKLKTELTNMASNKLESNELVADLARFLVAAGKQESLLDLLRDELLPALEERSPAVDDEESLIALIESLKLSKQGLKPATVERLIKIISADVPATSGTSVYAARRMTIQLLIQQLKVSPASLNSLISKVEDLNPKLVVLHGMRPSLHTRLFRNLKNKWPGVASDADTTATFELDLSALDAKLDADPIWHSSYRPEVVEAIDNQMLIREQTLVVAAWCQFLVAAAKTPTFSISNSTLEKWVLQLLEANSSALPLSLQQAEDERCFAALSLLRIARDEKSLRLLDVIYHQLIDLTNSPSAGLPALKPRLLASMNMAVILLSNTDEKSVEEDVKLIQILLGLLDVVVIKQLQIFGASEDTLALHLLILSNCLRIMKGANKWPKELALSMIESGSDATILREFTATTVSNAWKGELILTYVQEWLLSRIMTDTFVRNGLMNILIDAPLSRAIQQGGITAHKDADLHSLWRRGFLPIVAHLLRELESRISGEVSLFIENYSRQIVTCLEQWKSGHINTALIDETWLLCLILRSEPKKQMEKLGIRFDEEELAKTIDVLLNHKNYLTSRIAPAANIGIVVKELRTFHDWLVELI